MSCRCRHSNAAHEHIVRGAEFARLSVGTTGSSLNGAIDLAKTQFWNVAQSPDIAVRVLDPKKINLAGGAEAIDSDADDEILILVTFSEFVNIKGISVLGTYDGHSPSSVKLYSNRVDVNGFDAVARMEPDEKIELVNTTAEDEIIYHLKTFKFRNVSNLVLLFVGNHGGEDQTSLTKIEFYGEGTGKIVNRPLATNIVYELRGNPADHPIPEDDRLKMV